MSESSEGHWAHADGEPVRGQCVSPGPDTILPHPLTAGWTQRTGMAHPTLPTFYMGPNCWWAEHKAHMSHEEP